MKVYWVKIIFYVIAFFFACRMGIKIADQFTEYDSTDDYINKKRSGMALLIDYGTGCQYLSSRGRFLTPRLNKNGKHICK